MKFSPLLICLFMSASALAAGATATLQCGDEANLTSVKVGNITVDFISEPKKEEVPAPLSDKMKALAHLARVALHNGADPYALMALYSFGKNTVEAAGLSVARVLECPTRVKTDMKHFGATELATLAQAREKLRKLTSERSKIKGGDDYDEWLSLQKEIEKQQRASEEIRVKLNKLNGDKKEEAQDQINDNNEEIKGLKKEQEDYTKSPDMKRIVAIETEKYSVRQQIEGIRLKGMQGAAEGEKADVSKEFDCLKSEDCQGILLQSEKAASVDLSRPGEAAATQESSVCMNGESLNGGNVTFVKDGGTCCAKVKTNSGAKVNDEVSAVAAARRLRDTFSSCTSRPAENDCFAKYLDFKGECAHADGTKVAVQLISEFLANTEVNSMVATEAKLLKKPVISSFCVGQKKKSVTVEAASFVAERKKFLSLHKSCK